MKQATVFLSNRLEILLSHLKENLFSSEADPFSKRLVIIPSKAMEQWIKYSLAKDPQLQISAGLDFLFLNRATDVLLQLFYQTKETPFSYVELILAIEEILRTKKDAQEDPLWKPLANYLLNKEKRVLPLCSHLATLFQRYEIYGNQRLKEWRAEPKEWQQELWKLIFHNKKPLCEQLSTFDGNSKIEDLSVHIFSFSHLPAVYISFFEKLGRNLPVYFYTLSACSEFWSDIRSEKETYHFLLRKNVKSEVRTYLEDLCMENHPLLANLGKVGREQACLIEESGLHTIESYFPLQESSQLETLQADLLFFRPPDKMEFPPEDDSLQIHISTTRYRELENLYHTLLSIVENKEIEPKDIIVMAPDITLYVPFIETFFGEKLDYQIADMPFKKHHPLLKGIQLLISLEEHRWSASSLIELFQFQPFKIKQQWKDEDIDLIRAWIKEGGIRWGLNPEHRNRLLKKDLESSFESKGGTFREGISFLLSNLVIKEAPSSLSFVTAPLLGDVYCLLCALYEDLRVLYDGTRLSLSEWLDSLKRICETYFLVEDEEQEKFLIILNQFAKAAGKFIKSVYTFPFFFSLLETYSENDTLTKNPNQIQAVRFCSMLPMRSIPAKVICLIGMNEEAFPRKELLFSLDLLKNDSQADYYPSRLDFDRYLFLEAILSARTLFLMSYVGYSETDGKEKPPSLVISELLASYPIHHQIKHPHHSFDPAYFQRTSSLTTYSEVDYLRAQAALKKIPEPSFIPEFYVRTSKEPFLLPSGNMCIAITDLNRLARYPLKHYFQKGLSLFLRQEEEHVDEEPFTLSPLLVSQARKHFIKAPIDSFIEKASLQGQFPYGLLNKVAHHHLEEEKEFIDDLLVKYTLRKEDFYSITFVPNLDKLYFEKNKQHFHIPSPQFTLDKVKVQITGTLEGVTPQGLFVHEECSFKGAIPSWPAFLLLQGIEALPQEFSPQLLFGKKEGIKKWLDKATLPSFITFLDYYFHALKTPSPLFPEWVESFLKEDCTLLEKSMQVSLGDDFGRCYDQERHFVFNRHHLPSASMMIERWKDLAKQLYGDMYAAWF